MATKLRVPPGRTPLKQQSDARELVSMLAAGGHTDMSNEEVQKAYGVLSGMVGAPRAQKIFNQAILYNSRPESKALSPEERVQGFFEMGSNDPETNEYMRNLRGIGYGPIHGFRTSPLVDNKLLGGRTIVEGQTNEETLRAAPNEKNLSKAKLLVKKTVK